MKKAERVARAKKAGSTITPAKSAAARENGKLGGKLGGRPADPRIAAIMRERGVSRQRAHQILHKPIKK